MRRLLFTIAAALSLLACVATAALWVRSYWFGDSLYWYWSKENSAMRYTQFRSIRGILTAESDADRGPAKEKSWERMSEPVDDLWFVSSYPTPVILSFDHRDRWFRIATPFWVVAAASIITPALWLWKYGRQRFDRRDACRACSYNLTGNVSGICPECGTPTPAEGRA